MWSMPAVVSFYIMEYNLRRIRERRFVRQWYYVRFEVFASVTMLSAVSVMWRRMALVRTDVLEERSAYIIRVRRICELGTTLIVTSNRSTLRRNTIWECFADSLHPDDGGDTFIRKVGCYNNYTASEPRRLHSWLCYHDYWKQYVTYVSRAREL
jgi:hypothetical protein